MAVSMLCSCAVQENIASLPSAPETSATQQESSTVETTDSEETSKIETSAATTESTETSVPETEVTSRTETTTSATTTSVTEVTPIPETTTEITERPETEKPVEIETTTESATKTPETTTETHKTDDPNEEILLDVTPKSQGGLFESGSGIIAASMVLNYYGMNVDVWDLHKKLDIVDKDRNDITPWDYCMGNPETETALYYAQVIKNMINTYLNEKGISDFVATDITGCKTNYIFDYVIKGKPIIIVAHEMMRSDVEDGVSWTLPNGEEFVWKVDACFWVISGVTSSEVIAINGANGLQKSISKEKFERSFETYYSQAIIIE